VFDVMTRVGHKNNTVQVKLILLAHSFYILVSLRLIILPFVITQEEQVGDNRQPTDPKKSV
jgi:hypothetical protein